MCDLFNNNVFFVQMHKSGILKKAIDYINYLKKENARLKDENISLKMAQQQQSKNIITNETITGHIY